MSIRPKPEVRAKIEEIAKNNDVSLAYVTTLALANGLPIVELKFKELAKKPH